MIPNLRTDSERAIRDKGYLMKGYIFFFTEHGGETALKIGEALLQEGMESRIFTTAGQAEKYKLFETSSHGFSALAAEAFSQKDVLIVVGAAGIAVRLVAPLVKRKDSDSPVLVADEKGNFVIPLLSGHIGGANEIARMLARRLEAVPVITTATDVNGLFAVDEWAARKGFFLSSLKTAKAFAASLLARGRAGVVSDFPLTGSLPPGLTEGIREEAGMAVTVRTDVHPFAQTVCVHPPFLHVGVGCRRGKSVEDIEGFVREVLEQSNLSPLSVADINTVDIKADEKGLIECAERFGVPLHTYSSGELMKVPGSFTASDFVRSKVGTDNVCERAAAAAAKESVPLVRKQSRDGMTVAVFVENKEISWK